MQPSPLKLGTAKDPPEELMYTPEVGLEPAVNSSAAHTPLGFAKL